MLQGSWVAGIQWPATSKENQGVNYDRQVRMGFDFSRYSGLDERYVEWLVGEGAMESILHYERLWRYYRNETTEFSAAQETGSSTRPYRQAQEYGLPSRITGVQHGFYGGILGGATVPSVCRKEVVIENDIGWRVDTIVDFLFGRGVTICSQAKESTRRQEIEAILETVLAVNGGVTFLQQIALLGSVYGFVDIVLRWSDSSGSAAGKQEGRGTWTGFAGPEPSNFSEVLDRARMIFLEAIEAPRSLPVLDETDYRRIRYYIQHFWQLHNELSDESSPFIAESLFSGVSARQKQTHDVEILGPDFWQRYRDGALLYEGENPLGVVPVVHIQNMPQGLRYEGQSDVESLIPLQDELNTRLSDRANRVTFQSFKMYLGKGIEGFEDRAVAPGRMWSTENPEASIEEFGGDGGSPSEESHIDQIRDAMDKSSGVAPVAAGILKGRIGNLTSAVALKMTLMGVLAKTERKRQSYGGGLRELCRLILHALDRVGIYRTESHEREIEIRWPNPLPENVTERLQEAKLKLELGVPQDVVLRELGYGAESVKAE